MTEKQDEKKGAKTANAAEIASTKEDTYTVDELIAESKAVFGLSSECAVAALRPTGKEKMTVKEARTIVDKFMKKEVR